MTRQRQSTARILAVVFMCVLFFSFLFVVLESDHDCTGEDCSVCCQLGSCLERRRDLHPLLLTAVILFLSGPALLALPSAPVSAFDSHSLVTLKVKLSD